MESKNGTNEIVYKTEIESQMYKTNLDGYQEGSGGRDELGDWDWHIHTTMYKIDD